LRAVIQRVSSASVTVDGKVVAKIERGFLVLAGFTHDDNEAAIVWAVRKIAGMRLFEDDDGKMNLALADVGGAILAVPQFTLYADIAKGRRPAFTDAARPEVATPLFDRFCQLLESEGLPVSRGIFGAKMEVALVNDGPVTIIVERTSD